MEAVRGMVWIFSGIAQSERLKVVFTYWSVCVSFLFQTLMNVSRISAGMEQRAGYFLKT